MWLVLALFVAPFLAWLALRARTTHVDVTRNVLLVTAHPDDELMFFGPTLLQHMRARARLATNGPHSKVHLLCLSNGDFYGDGSRRAQELTDACYYLLDYASDFKQHKQDDNQEIFVLKVIVDSQLPDSPVTKWPSRVISQYVSDYVHANQIGQVLTFDRAGVSGHLNHVAIHDALNHSVFAPVELWKLETVPLWRKYLSFWDIVPTLVQSVIEGPGQIHLVSVRDYFHLVQALRHHRSQMLWFRYLYSLSSRYMFVNNLSK